MGWGTSSSGKEVRSKIAKTSLIDIFLHVRFVNRMILQAFGLFQKFLVRNPIPKCGSAYVDSQVDA